MKQIQRTPAQIREHYEIEKQLAQKLRSSTRQERQTLYTTLYDDLFRNVPHHPQITSKSSQEESSRKIAWQIRHLKSFLKKDTNFLEVGPGDCALSIEVSRLVKKVYAIDVSEEITKNLTPPANFNLVLSDGTNIPIPANSINVAYSHQLMEHLHPDDALEQLHNIFLALAPGGVYICITPNCLNGPHDVSKYFDTVATGFHLKEYTVSELDQLLKATGFSKVRIFVPIKKMRIFLPVFPVKLYEKFLIALPYSLRKSLASIWLAAKLLGINIVGIK